MRKLNEIKNTKNYVMILTDSKELSLAVKRYLAYTLNIPQELIFPYSFDEFDKDEILDKDFSNVNTLIIEPYRIMKIKGNDYLVNYGAKLFCSMNIPHKFILYTYVSEPPPFKNFIKITRFFELKNIWYEKHKDIKFEEVAKYFPTQEPEHAHYSNPVIKEKHHKIIEDENLKKQLMGLVGDTLILVVDDEYKLWKAPLVMGLKTPYFPQWKFLWAENVEQTIKLINEKKPDIILLDLNLNPNKPDDPSGGIKILEYIKTKHLRIPVIVHSKFKDINIAKEVVGKHHLEALNYFKKDDTIKKGDYSKLLKAILEGLYLYGKLRNEFGILVTHGTDTMAFGLSILKYMIRKSLVNIVLTGSQIPLEGFFSPSDAIGNLKTSLYALTYLIPPKVVVCFNNGKTIYSGNLRKKNKWNENAFEGEILTNIVWDKPVVNEDKFISKDNKLEKIYLIRTGGTIESKRDPETGALVPLGDFVATYLHSTLQKDFFGELLNCYESFKLDSSYMTLKKWFEIGNYIREIIKKEFGEGHGEIDQNFSENVKPVFLNPFLKKEDYEYIFENAEGVIILGYGAGNANIKEDEFPEHNIISLVKKYAEKIPIVISSQVPGEDYDFEYEAGWKLIEAGCVPSGKFSFEESQIRLAYILGHKDKIEEIARDLNLHPLDVIKIFFIMGMRFRTEESKRKYIKFLRENSKIIYIEYDYVSDPLYSFDEIAEIVKNHLSKTRG